jgi:hypothetical protein
MYAYNYTKTNGTSMMEFHVDDHAYFQNIQSDLIFGASFSVRKPTSSKPIIIFGQDECIFKQFKFTKKTWRLPDGRYLLLPKDDGAGIMVSAFVSREYGFGLTNLTHTNHMFSTSSCQRMLDPHAMVIHIR